MSPIRGTRRGSGKPPDEPGSQPSNTEPPASQIKIEKLPDNSPDAPDKTTVATDTKTGIDLATALADAGKKATEAVSSADIDRAMEHFLQGGTLKQDALAVALGIGVTQAALILGELAFKKLLQAPDKPGEDYKPTSRLENLREAAKQALLPKPDMPGTPDKLPEPKEPLATIQTRAGGAAEDLDTTSTPKPEETPKETETPPKTPKETPDTETPPRHPPETTPSSRWDSILSPFRDAYKRFVSKFSGETQPEEEKDYKATWGDVGKNAAAGIISVSASYLGVKVFADLPPWLYQKYWTNPDERKRLKKSFAVRKEELEMAVEEHNVIELRKERLTRAVNESKFLSKEKKEELLKNIDATINNYKTKEENLKKERNEEIAKLLDNAIQTRIRSTQVLKEGLNTVLMVTGLAAMRGLAYGAVATAERYQDVAKRLEQEGKKKGKDFYKEWIIGGFTETVQNIKGGNADTWKGKGVNMVKGWTNVMRAAGFAELAFSDFSDPHVSRGLLIDKALEAWEKNGETDIDLGEKELPGESDATEPREPAKGGSGPDKGAEIPPSPPDKVEIPDEKTIKVGTVKKGDGILRILQREGVDPKEALKAAREAGIVSADGDIRLATKAIGRLSVYAETNAEGEIEIKFFDTKTDTPMTLEEVQKAKFTYPDSTPEHTPIESPQENATHHEVPYKETNFKDSEAPNDLLNNTFHIFVDNSGNFTGIDIGGDNEPERILDAITELKKQRFTESPEYKYLYEQYSQLTGEEKPAAQVSPNQVEPSAEQIQQPQTEPLIKFRSDSGVVKFHYDKKGNVTDAYMPGYRPKMKEIDAALTEWKLTRDQVKEHFYQGHTLTNSSGGWRGSTNDSGTILSPRPGVIDQSPDTLYRHFVRNAEKLSRQQAILEEMQKEGFENTQEFKLLEKETTSLKKYVTDAMKKEFKITQKK